MQAKNASPSKGSDSLVKMFTESDFLMSREEGAETGGLALSGGRSPSSSSAMEAVRGLGGAGLLKSSSNMERGDMDSESKRKRAPEPSRALLATDAGDAVASSGSNANLRIHQFCLIFNPTFIHGSIHCMYIFACEFCIFLCIF